MPPEELPTLPHEIGSPEDYLPPTPLWVWLVGGALALLFLYFLVSWIRRFTGGSKAVSAPGPDYFVLAAQRLDALKKETSSLAIAPFASSVSMVFRECLAKVLNDPALFETDEEIALRLQSLERVPPSARILLSDLSAAKYAPSGTNPGQAEEFIQQASDALRDVYQSQKPSES